MAQPPPLEIDRGDARTWEVRFSTKAADGTKTPLNLTGWTLSLFDVSAELQGKVSIAWTDAAAGKAALILLSIPDLAVYPKVHNLRILRVPPSGDVAMGEASPLIRIIAR